MIIVLLAVSAYILWRWFWLWAQTTVDAENVRVAAARQEALNAWVKAAYEPEESAEPVFQTARELTEYYSKRTS